MSFVILCEGKTDKKFLQLFLETLNIKTTDDNFLILGNKSNFFKINNEEYQQLLTDISLEKVDKVLFVIDADDGKNDSKYGGYKNTVIELKKIIDELKAKLTNLF